jgi:hypothetical protein
MLIFSDRLSQSIQFAILTLAIIDLANPNGESMRAILRSPKGGSSPVSQAGKVHPEARVPDVEGFVALYCSIGLGLIAGAFFANQRQRVVFSTPDGCSIGREDD